MPANLVSFVEINISVQILSLHLDVEGELSVVEESSKLIHFILLLSLQCAQSANVYLDSTYLKDEKFT